MTLQAPGSVVAGTSFQANYSFHKSKAGGVVAIYPGGPRSVFAVTVDQAGQLQQLGAIASAPMGGPSGVVTLVAPSTPGQYGIATVYGPDGGTIDTASLMVTAPAAAAPAPTAATPAAGAAAAAASGYTAYTPPSPEPKASDSQALSMQASDVQTYYVSNFGPGVLAATQFVIDHEHQLAALGASHPAPDPCSTAPLITLEAWINKYSTGTVPGAVYAQVMVPDCPDGPARVGINTPSRLAGPVTLPAGPGAGGPDIGLLGGGGAWSSTGTPTVPNQRQTGAAAPSVGGVLSDLTANKPLLIGLGLAAAYFAFSGRHRR